MLKLAKKIALYLLLKLNNKALRGLIFRISMTKKRILIAGGAGFIGSHLCDRFMAEGYQVIAMDNLLTGDLTNMM